MQKLQRVHLERIVAHYSTTFDHIDSEAKLYGLATVLLRHYLGNEWSSENINVEHRNVEKRSRDGRSFLRTEYDQAEERLRHQERVVRLSELIYNLQDLEGIEGRLASIQAGVTEPTYAELEFAGHFYRRGISIQFLERSGVKGHDYDFEATLGSTNVSCEVKCNLEETDLRQNTIINTLKKARKQIPPGNPGIIGVKIPEAWVSEKGSAGIFVAALEEFFRNSSRVIAVIVRWEETKLIPGTGGVILYWFKTYRNESITLLNQDLLALIETLSDESSKRWVSLRDFV